MSPPRGEKPIFGPVSTCNTGMAALHWPGRLLSSVDAEGRQFKHYLRLKTYKNFISAVCCIYEENKCIGDDTKAAARQSLNCIKNKQKIWRKTIFDMADGILTPCNVARGSEIVTVNSPSGSSTLQCDTLG